MGLANKTGDQIHSIFELEHLCDREVGVVSLPMQGFFSTLPLRLVLFQLTHTPQWVLSTPQG